MADTFTCAKCGCDVLWELGAADDEPNSCDACYGKKITTRLDTDALTHHTGHMRTTKRVELRVTTKDMGVREVAWVGKDAERLAKFYTQLWESAGHKVERI